ncbi:MAG: cation:proton antiporter [Phycisphaerales bacterium]|nr:MAG: cation:proton antiporter [Phycisphaerales bacterium]
MQDPTEPTSQTAADSATASVGEGTAAEVVEAVREATPLVGEPVGIFAGLLLVLFLAPLLARMARLPSIVGLLVAGIVLGPHALHVFDRDSTVILLGTVGLLYIVFLAGLDIDLHEFKRHRRTSLIFGSITVGVPLVLGIIAAKTLLGMSWPAAILLASMFASHTLLAYPIVARLGVNKTRAVTTTVGGTLMTDTTALLILAIIAGSQEGELTPLFWAQLVGFLAVYVGAILWGVPLIARRYFKHLPDRGVRDVVFVLAMGYLCAWLAPLAGMEPIIGAFLAGLALNRFIPNQGTLMNRVNFIGQALFVPLFLVSVGMLVNVGMIVTSPEAWLAAGVMAGTVTLSKYLAAKLSQRVLGFNRDEGDVMFGLSVPQAAATLAAVFVGFRIELFGEEILNGAVFMILVTCLIGPWFVERAGRKIAIAEEQEPAGAGQTPARILVPIANPESAPELMDLALVARPAVSHEAVYPMVVVRDTDDPDAEVAAGEKTLGKAVVHASAAGVTVIPVTRVDMSVANGITRAITELRIGTLVIGWSGDPSLRRRPLGTVIDQVLEDTAQMVLVCKIDHRINTTKRLLVLAPQFASRQPGFIELMQTIGRLAGGLGAKITVLGSATELKGIETRLEGVKLKAPVVYDALRSWAEVIPRLRGEATPDDMIVVLSAREGRLAWTHQLSRMPRRIVDTFPKNNIVVAFPADPVQRNTWVGAYSLPESETLIDESRILLDLDPSELGPAIEQLLQPKLGSRAGEARDTIVKAASEYAAQLGAGVVLVHAHVAWVTKPTVYIATFKEGLKLARIEDPARVVLVLLSPVSLPPEAHLRTLAKLAKIFYQKKTGEKIASAETPEQVLKIIHEGASKQDEG